MADHLATFIELAGLIRSPWTDENKFPTDLLFIILEPVSPSIHKLFFVLRTAFRRIFRSWNWERVGRVGRN